MAIDHRRRSRIQIEFCPARPDDLHAESRDPAARETNQAPPMILLTMEAGIVEANLPSRLRADFQNRRIDGKEDRRTPPEMDFV